MNSILHLEETALELKALLTVLSAANGDNRQAMQEMPYALQVAARMADDLYCTIADARAQEVR